MISISLDAAKDGNIYRMCMLAARRAQDLSNGALPHLNNETGKLTTLALKEVIGGFVEEEVGSEPVMDKDGSESK